jgi:hypothetical protein
VFGSCRFPGRLHPGGSREVCLLAAYPSRPFLAGREESGQQAQVHEPLSDAGDDPAIRPRAARE